MCAHYGRRWPSPWPSRSCNHAHAQLRKRTQAIQEATDLEGWVLGALTLAPGRASTVGSAAASGSSATPARRRRPRRPAPPASCASPPAAQPPPFPSPSHATSPRLSDPPSLTVLLWGEWSWRELPSMKPSFIGKDSCQKNKNKTPLPGIEPEPRDRREYSPLYYNDFAAPALKRILITFSSIFSICTTCQSIARIS